MTPEIKGFFRKTMPKDTAGHVLALGESHTKSDHLTYLKQCLPELVAEHHLGTIGIELPFAMNAFFWAYKDGTLEEMLGSKEDAALYLKIVCTSFFNTPFADNAKAMADLVVAALDADVRIACYDSRHTKEDVIVKGEQSRINPKLDWVVAEFEELCKENSSYKPRLEKMETLVATGREKKIGSDALSATLFAMVADPHKNSLTIIGNGHINTKGYYNRNANALIHGTFPDHLEWLQANEHKGLKVQTAVLAATGWSDIFHTDYKADAQYMHEHFDGYSFEDAWKKAQAEVLPASNFALVHKPSRRERPTIKVDIDKGVVEPIVQPGEEEAVPIEKRFFAASAVQDASLVRQRMNPLLVPAIRQAAEAVKADWNGGAAAQMAR